MYSNYTYFINNYIQEARRWGKIYFKTKLHR